MLLEKEIMGERLTGLYKSLDNILGNLSVTNKITEEFQLYFAEGKKIAYEVDISNQNSFDATTQKDKIMKQYLNLTENRSDLMTQKEKALKLLKEKFSSLQKELNVASEEKEIFKGKLEESEKKLLDITEEFKKYRHKTKLTYSYVTGNEEKFCKNCQKSFYESENYNWSCRTHASKLVGDTYWCCGRTGKDTIGCIVSRHLVKEEGDIEELSVLSSIKYCSVRFIQACKTTEHTLSECYRDPNIKTNADLTEEIERIKNIEKSRRKIIQNTELQQKVSNMLNNRSVVLQETYNELDEDEIFNDLMNIKQEIDFEQSANRVNIELIDEKRNFKDRRTTSKEPSMYLKGFSLIKK
jgi:hypothetical protein